MRLRSLYLLVGLVLGSLAGVAVAFQVFAFAAGVSWLFLFGDDPWPAGVERYLIGIPLVAGLATLAAGLGVGYAFGRRSEAGPGPERARRRGHGLLLAGLALWLLVAVLAGWQTERQSAARATAAVQEAAFADLRQARHVVTGIGVADDGGETLHITLDLAGSRRGAYRLTWQLDETTYDRTLSSGERHLDLGPEAPPLDLAFEPARLAERYRATVLDGRPDKVLVDGPFRLRLWLEPLLTDDERRALPAREIGNLERGLSELRFETELDVPMTLDLTRP